MPKSSNVLRRRAVDGESLFIALLFRYNLYNFGMSHPMEFGILGSAIVLGNKEVFQVWTVLRDCLEN